MSTYIVGSRFLERLVFAMPGSRPPIVEQLGQGQTLIQRSKILGGGWDTVIQENLLIGCVHRHSGGEVGLTGIVRDSELWWMQPPSQDGGIVHKTQYLQTLGTPRFQNGAELCSQSWQRATSELASGDKGTASHLGFRSINSIVAKLFLCIGPNLLDHLCWAHGSLPHPTETHWSNYWTSNWTGTATNHSWLLCSNENHSITSVSIDNNQIHNADARKRASDSRKRHGFHKQMASKDQT